MNKKELKATAIATGIVIFGVLAILYITDIYNIKKGFDEERQLRGDLQLFDLDINELERWKYQDDDSLILVYCGEGYRITKFYKKAILSSNLYLEDYEFEGGVLVGA